MCHLDRVNLQDASQDQQGLQSSPLWEGTKQSLLNPRTHLNLVSGEGTFPAPVPVLGTEGPAADRPVVTGL